MIRLNKLMAERGVGARRKCDLLIAEGRVRVNGRVVTEAGTKVEEQRDRVEVDGKPLPRPATHRYFVLNKPVGVITTMDDPHGRRTVREFLPSGGRFYPVGRLDADTSGLLLLTNDGELAHRLMHPRYGVEKVYRVRLEREPSAGQLTRLARGVEFEPGVRSAPARVYRARTEFDAIMIEIAIHEGRYRQVRRMFETVGLEVKGLHRVAYGPVRLGPLARGMFRELSEDEVARLRSASARPHARPAGIGRPARVGRSIPGVKPRAAEELAPRTRREVGFRADRPARAERPSGPARPGRERAARRMPGRPATHAGTAWPARADGRRGDADFTPPAGGPPALRRPLGGAPRREESPRAERFEHAEPVWRRERPRPAGDPPRRTARPEGDAPRRTARPAGDAPRRTARPTRDARGDRDERRPARVRDARGPRREHEESAFRPPRRRAGGTPGRSRPEARQGSAGPRERGRAPARPAPGRFREERPRRDGFRSAGPDRGGPGAGRGRPARTGGGERTQGRGARPSRPGGPPSGRPRSGGTQRPGRPGRGGGRSR